MTTISATLVKELREMTGAGMMDCKKALTETKGSIEDAVDWLRKKGLAKAGSKSGRVAAEGLVGVLAEGKSAVVVEINSETDFVARNDQFQDMVRKVTTIATAANGDVEKILAMTYPGKTTTVDEVVKEAIATIGENMNVRRSAVVQVSDGVVADYVHNKVADGLGKIGVLVGLESKGDKPALFELGRQIAMHVAARNPVALDLAGVSKDVLDREKAIIMDKNKGKPPQVLEKIAESSMKTYAKENCLLEQGFVMDDSKSVTQALKEAEKTVGAPIKLTAFVRFALGEGIEKPKDDFSAEVASMAKG
ncbi:MAG: translation elongation factor Ts [Hyphomicrobiaceae bacterium]